MNKYKAENILPYNESESKSTQVRKMFDSIAPAYDKLNRIMTFGIDRRWRKEAVKILCSYAPQYILDIATGTGDLAFLLNRSLRAEKIIGADISEGMLEIAREKTKKYGFERDMKFECQDCLSLTYEDNTFNAITVAYGVRNFENLDKGFSEMYRVLAPEGILMVIELSTPQKFPLKQFYNLYSRYFIPFVGSLISKDKKAYTYLPKSVAVVPQGKEMLKVFQNAGFKNTRYKQMTFGICTIYVGEK